MHCADLGLGNYTCRLGNADLWYKCHKCSTETLEKEDECRCCTDFPSVTVQGYQVTVARIVDCDSVLARNEELQFTVHLPAITKFS